MPGINTGIGNRIGQFSGVAPWNPLKPLAGETPNLWVKENSRNGLTLTDSVNPGAGDITITLPHVSTALGFGYNTDAGGAMDIGATDFTWCGWWKSNDTNKTIARCLGGKYQGSGAIEGFFSWWVNITTGLLTFYAKSSIGLITVNTNVDYVTQAWFFLLVDINQTTKKLRLFINNVQYGADVDYTGTFALSGLRYSVGAGGNNNYASANSYSDVRKYNKILTTTERTTLFNKGNVSGAVCNHPCNDELFHDCSGNGYHLTLSNVDASEIAYSSYGSRQLLDKGYSLYKKQTLLDYYVPYTDGGVPIVTSNVIAGYTKKVFIDDNPHDVPGDLLNHNLAPSKLTFTQNEWDRTGSKVWYIYEINKDFLTSAKLFPKISDYSAYDRKSLKELFSYTFDKTGNDFKKVLRYTGDDEWYHTVDYYFDSVSIRAQRASKKLAFDYATKILSLSLDNGTTYPITLDLTGIATIITDAYIYANGDITFASHTKHYYSIDNLATYHESTTLGINGLTFIPSTYNNFRSTTSDNFTFFGSQEFRIWGCYSVDIGTINTNINIWFSFDNGVTVKSVYKFSVTDPPLLDATHVHAINFNTDDNSLWVQTGDIATKCHWIKGTYNIGLDTWTWTEIGTGDENTFYKSTGMVFYNNEVLWSSDAGNLYNYGLWRGKYDDITNSAKHHRVNIGNILDSKYVWYLSKDGDNLIAGVALTKAIVTSSNKGRYFRYTVLTGCPEILAGGVSGAIMNFIPKDSSGYIRGDIQEQGEALAADSWERGTVGMFKITK